jgi:hypothetical protein
LAICCIRGRILPIFADEFGSTIRNSFPILPPFTPHLKITNPVKMGLKVRKLRDLLHFTRSTSFLAICVISRDLRFYCSPFSYVMSLERALPLGNAAPLLGI